MSEQGHRRYGLYWNRRGELYDIVHLADTETPLGATYDRCRIRNLTTGSESNQPCSEALDGHLDVGWFFPATSAGLEIAFNRDCQVEELRR